MPDRTKTPNRGRTTPKKAQGGRYTPPIPREVRRSPRWYPWVLSLLVLGIVTIILNYVGARPDSPANWYTLGAILGILVSALAATRYH